MKTPTFEHECQYWQREIRYIAGIDEVGIGALAGPVVASAVIFDSAELGIMNEELGIPIRDSKLLSEQQRDKANEWIQKNALTWAIGEATVEEITKWNVRGAAQLAMRRAVEQLDPVPGILLVDGLPSQPHPTIPAENIINGDELCFSVAAASILAKVHRDEIMLKLHKEFPEYKFFSHKGYGTKLHLEALQSHGPSPYHRPTYAPVTAILTK